MWTEELIEKEILEIVDTLNERRMPTRKEAFSFCGDQRLTNKISKTIGYYGWAEKLGLAIKSSNTLTGKIFESYAANLLADNGHCVEHMPTNYPYDLLVDGSVRVDVKFSELLRSKSGYGYFSFSLRKKYPTCDIYLLIADDGSEKDVYIIPAMSVVQTQISMGEHYSTYRRYIDRFDYIDKISAFVAGLRGA